VLNSGAARNRVNHFLGPLAHENRIVVHRTGSPPASRFLLVKNREVVKVTTVNEAGRKGGLTVLNNRGKEHFSEIGRKGQEKMRELHPGMASEWGKKGGRPRKH